MEEESDSPTVGMCAVYSAVDSATTDASATTMVANSIGITNPSSVTLSRNIGIESTRLLFMGNNFQNARSDQDIFYDCEDTPTIGRSAGPSKCQLDDPAAIREALERAANATQMLLKNFDKSGGWPSAVTLELTARLVNPKNPKARGPTHSKPVTVQMPLEFNSQSGKIAPCQQRKMVPSKAHKEPVCHCRAHGKRTCPMHAGPGQAGQAPNTGKSAWEPCHPCESALAERSGPPMPAEPVHERPFMGSCGDSSSRSYICHRGTCRHPYDPDAREVISICYLPVPEPQSESEEEVVSLMEEKMVEPVVEEKPFVPIYESDDSDAIGVTSESSQYSSEERVTVEKEITPEKPIVPEPKAEEPPSKRYYMALPQNKDFSNCSPCRYDPSPIMDEEGNVFCPGNCGCCMCPWIKRSLATNWEHINVKVCRCVQRGTIFTKFEDREICSQASYFDFCPCREKAEAKYLELYNREMWSRPDAIRGREIRLTEIKELAVPPQRQSE